MTTTKQYRFEECMATNVAGHKCTIPAGIHSVARNSLSARVRVGGREIDVTVAEFMRLTEEGRLTEA